MSRDDGFDVADVDTNLFDDTKTKALWRALGDQQQMAAAMTLYTATLLASWRHGCRVMVTEAVPIWLTPDPEIVHAMRRAKLLDRTGKVPLHSWRSWFDPAYERRERRRERGRLGGLAAAGRPRKAQVQRKNGTSAPDRPSGRSVVTSTKLPSRGRAREAEAAAPRDEAMSADDVRQLLKRNGTLRVVDRDALLSEPMPVAASAVLGVDEP